jgi:hypothetical protein
MGHTIYDITSWVVDGINEKGLALCVTTAYATATEPYPEFGLQTAAEQSAMCRR